MVYLIRFEVYHTGLKGHNRATIFGGKVEKHVDDYCVDS